MFEVGEYIVYGCKGVCQVEEITHIDIPGSNKDRLYYVLAPLEDRNGKIYAPTDNAKVAMRKVITTNGEFHLHNAKRKQYSPILHSLHFSYDTVLIQ